METIASGLPTDNASPPPRRMPAVELGLDAGPTPGVARGVRRALRGTSVALRRGNPTFQSSV